MKLTRISNKRATYWDFHKTVAETYASLSSYARPTRDHYILVILSAMVGSVGMLLGNPAVIIGAVIIAPLMGPILGFSLSIIMQKRILGIRFLWVLLLSILLIILVSNCFGFAFSFLGFTPEMTQRTQPNILHILLALTGGFLGGYGRIRSNILDRAFGVAMSVSLLPPLCVTGITLAHGRYDLSFGALLFFVSNLLSILCGSMAAFALLDFKKFHIKTLKRLVIPAISLILLAVPSYFAFEELGTERFIAHELGNLLREDKQKLPVWEINEINTSGSNPLTVVLSLEVPQDKQISPAQATFLKQFLEKKLKKKIKLILHIHATPIEELEV